MKQSLLKQAQPHPCMAKATITYPRAGQRLRGSSKHLDVHVRSSAVELGSSGLKVSKIGLGTIKWGDRSQGFGMGFSEEDLQKVFQIAIDGGVNFFDTAEVYGYQNIKNGNSSESILGRAVGGHNVNNQGRLIVGTKFFTIPWTNLLVGGGLRLGQASIREALTASLQRLGKVQLYQVHFPFPTMSQKVIAEALLEILDKGLVEAVGVCNYDTKQTRELQGLLQKGGASLATNQVKLSLLEREPLTSDLAAACEDLGITIVAHSPLAQGKLTDRNLETMAEGEKLRPLLKLMQFIGAVYGGKSIAQVAINYLAAKGTVPIPGASGSAQVTDLVKTLNWDLEENEVGAIDEKLVSMGI